MSATKEGGNPACTYSGKNSTSQLTRLDSLSALSPLPRNFRRPCLLFIFPSISCKVMLSKKPNKEAEAIISALIKCSAHHFDGNEFSSPYEKSVVAFSSSLIANFVMY